MATFIIEQSKTLLYLFKVEANSEEEALEKMQEAINSNDELYANGCVEMFTNEPQIFDEEYWSDEYDFDLESEIEDLPE